MFRNDIKPFYINSSVRDAGGSNEDFTITDTRETIDNAPKTVKLLNACIPFTWNNVPDTGGGGSELQFTDSVPTVYTVTVPAGNYTGTTLATAVAAAMNAAGSPDTFSVTFDSNTYKMTFTTTGADMELNFTTIDDMAETLGFDAGTDYGPAASITSVNVVNILGYLEMFICSDLVCGSDNGVIPWTTSSPVSDLCVLARVPIRACYGGVVDYVAQTELPAFPVTQSEFVAETLEPRTVARSMRFYLRWPDNTPVDLNGAVWTAELIFNFNE